MTIDSDTASAFGTMKFVAIGALALLFGIAGAYAGPKEHGANMAYPPKNTVYGTPGNAYEIDRTVLVRAKGMKFDVGSFQFAAGETVRFIVVNEADVEHDFTLGDVATQKSHRKKMARLMARDDRMPVVMYHNDVNAVSLDPGQTKELVWQFNRTGLFEFACNVPGHYDAGMRGTITVELATKNDAHG